MITHSKRRGSTPQRSCARKTSRGLQRRLTDWATDPRTTTPQLHTALDEVLKNEPNPDWDISAIKYAYLEVMREIEQPMPLFVQQEMADWTFGLGDMALSPTMIDYLKAARCFLLREPDRSRRVLRLLFAQYLAHLETRELPSRKPAVWARLSWLSSTNPVTKSTIKVPLYPVRPGAPAGARALPPQAVAGWLVATLDARVWLAWGGIATNGPGHRIVLETARALRTARHTVNSSSCWPRRFVAASAEACHLPTKPWSGPISRACPTTDRPTSTMERRRQSSSGFGRLGPSEPRCCSGSPAAAQRSRRRLRCL